MHTHTHKKKERKKTTNTGSTHALINDNKVLQNLTLLSIPVHPRPSVTVQQVLIHYLINRFEKLIPSQTWIFSISSSAIHLCLTRRQRWGIPIQHTVITLENQHHVYTQIGGEAEKKQKKKKQANAPHLPLLDSQFEFLFLLVCHQRVQIAKW